jgi:TonB family protein
MLSISALLHAASALTAAQAEPAKPLLAATSKWTVEYAENSCNIGKTFGASGREVKLWMKLLPGRANSQLLIEEDRPGTPTFRTGDLIITPASGKALTVKARNGSVNAGSSLILGEVDSNHLSALAESDTLALSYRGKAFQLSGVNLKAALAAVRDCEDDLLRKWGFDPAEFQKIAIPPKSLHDPAEVYTGGDYPIRELNAGRVGSVVVKLDLSATGNVAACSAVVSSGIEAFDQRGCTIAMKRTRFAPAQLADGTAVPSIVFLQFRWNIES